MLAYNFYIFLATNVALGKHANQTEDVTWNGWVWSADKAVDGCTDADRPDDQECCSTSLPTQGQPINIWSVYLLALYDIESITIIGRSGNFRNSNVSKKFTYFIAL